MAELSPSLGEQNERPNLQKQMQWDLNLRFLSPLDDHVEVGADVGADINAVNALFAHLTLFEEIRVLDKSEPVSTANDLALFRERIDVKMGVGPDRNRQGT